MDGGRGTQQQPVQNSYSSIHPKKETSVENYMKYQTIRGTGADEINTLS